VTISQERHSVSPDEYEAWLFDLDGVITDTARVHAAAWKATFDEYLKEVSEREEKSFEPFEIDPDYYRYVDGKPRYAGVDSFLRSRGIIVAWGDPSDPPSRETVCGIGNRKNALFNEVLGLRGVEVFETSVALIQELRTRGRRVAGSLQARTLTQCYRRPVFRTSLMLESTASLPRRRNSPASPPPTPMKKPPVCSGHSRSRPS
jgi:phosphoglycolate phosphatase-like HAD superfamily hydrolase